MHQLMSHYYQFGSGKPVTFRRCTILNHNLPQAGMTMAIMKEAKVADKEVVGGMWPDKLW